jgi:ATP-binding cassette subfamily C (CFTR/MRP) protein 4
VIFTEVSNLILARSSVFAHISATIQGLTTIRALNAEKILIREFDNHQDYHTSAFHLYLAMFSSFGFWADVMGVLYNGLVIFGFFLIKSGMFIKFYEKNIFRFFLEIFASSVGLAVCLSNALLLVLQYAMKTWTQLNAQMTAVERVVEYSELSLEPNDGVQTPPESWPTSGNISFHSVSLRYSSKDAPVLKNVSFNIKSKEKIGIIGRTGAGKTSLISVLFRLFHFEGSVVIDNIDIKSIPLTELRSKIAVIPQDPLLFLGSLRKNLDPFGQYDDLQLWTALDEFELKEVISNLPSGLDSMVSERGSNFSVGQRQLLCLVRAMLKESKIIVLDEATANVDLETDELIQSSIRKRFKNCTVLTIAHRLNTVIDSDKILVMDEGLVVEFGPPHQLLQNREGFFYRYVKKGGVQVLTDLANTVENVSDFVF